MHFYRKFPYGSRDTKVQEMTKNVLTREEEKGTVSKLM